MGTKISALPVASALGGTEALPGVQSGSNVKITAAQLRTYVLAGLAAISSSGSAADLVAGTIPSARMPALTGDVTTSSGGVATAIGANKVLRPMLSQMTFAGFLGATGAGNVTDLTIAQAKAALAIGGSDLTLGVSTQTGTAYTAVLGDAMSYIRFTNGSAVTLTVPANSTAAFPIGTVIEIEQAGAGALSVSAAGGVTINSRGADLTLAGQYSVAALKKTATDTWTLMGDL